MKYIFTSSFIFEYLDSVYDFENFMISIFDLCINKESFHAT